ncbi:MAG TPA: DUF4255 domain-containing protein [Polyangiaceae bacterium]
MSDPLAISAVTAVLQYYLQNLFAGIQASTFDGMVTVSALAPDLVQESFGSSAKEHQVNLFMHQVSYNQAWRNVQLPSLDADGKTRLTSPPLALDLHYLLTAYGSEDCHAEGILGYAVMMLHENPVLARDDIRHALLNLPSTNPISGALKTSTLADQIEMIKIIPATVGKEELAWLWTALKADYRPTFPFQVSVVLIQPQRNASLALPVLRRRLGAQPIQPAQILAVQPPNRQVAAAFSDTVTVTGEFLGNVSQAWLTNPRYAVAFPVKVTGVTNTQFNFVPGSQTTYPGGIPAGIYTLVGQILDGTGTEVLQSTNALSVALAPTLATQTQAAALNAGVLSVPITFSPPAWEGQAVALSLCSTAPPAPSAALYAVTAPPVGPIADGSTTIDFQFAAKPPAGPLLARLTIDGVTSQVQVDWTQHPPTFLGPMVTVT